MKRNTRNYFLALIVFIAAFLRLWRIQENFQFIGDYAWYYLQARDFLLGGDFPLVGIPSSLPVFRQGAVWTWLLSFSLLLGNYDPLSGLIFPIILNIITIWLSYVVSKNIFSEKVGLWTALFLATSSLVITNSNIPYQTSLILPAILVSYYLIIKAKRNGISNYYFYSGISLALLHQIFTGSFLYTLSLIFCVYLIKVPKTSLKNWIYLASGIVIGLAPLIVFDIQSGVFMQTIGFVAWFLSKSLEIIKNIGNIGSSIAWKRLNEPLMQFYFQYSLTVSKLLLLSSIGGIFVVIRRKVLDFPKLLLVFWMVGSIIGFLLRGYDNKAFYPVFFYPMALLMVIFIDKIIRNKYIISFIFLTVSILNTKSFLTKESVRDIGYQSSYTLDLEVVDRVLNDSKDEDFDFEVVAKLSQFEAYDDDFEYLFWWKGKKITKESKIKYRLVIKDKIKEDNRLLIYETDKTKLFKILYD